MIQNRRSVLLLSLWLGLFAPCVAGEPFRYPAARQSDKAELQYINGLPVLVVSGSPEELGKAAGLLALAPAQRVIDYPRDLLKFHRVEAVYDLFVQSGEGMAKQFPAAYQQEMEALVSASKVERTKVVVGNTFFDLKKVFACSALLLEAERSSTGGPLLGRNLDYPSMGYIHEYTLVTIYRPAGKHAFASIGFPGLLGCLSGMNDAGLALGVLEVFDVKDGEKGFDPKGVPYALCLRKVLEECTTIAQAKKCLEEQRRTTTINVVIADRQGVATLEVTPGRVELRGAEQGTCSCTNHYCTAALRPAEPVNVNETFERFASLDKVRPGKARLSPDDVRRQLDAVCLGELTMQTMVFEPATLRLHLAFGKLPASQGELCTLDLRPLFGKMKNSK